ncbi:MAG: hypothetical protein CL912_07695 [Deltaproteobacteria bacterium]|nr:hypothetical protein [Deltaproteobacteria bacterium]
MEPFEDPQPSSPENSWSTRLYYACRPQTSQGANTYKEAVPMAPSWPGKCWRNKLERSTDMAGAIPVTRF